MCYILTTSSHSTLFLVVGFSVAIEMPYVHISSKNIHAVLLWLKLHLAECKNNSGQYSVHKNARHNATSCRKILAHNIFVLAVSLNGSLKLSRHI